MAKLERKLKQILDKERTVTSVADELKVSRQTIYKWLEIYEKKGAKGFAFKKIKGGVFAEESVVLRSQKKVKEVSSVEVEIAHENPVTAVSTVHSEEVIATVSEPVSVLKTDAVLEEIALPEVQRPETSLLSSAPVLTKSFYTRVSGITSQLRIVSVMASVIFVIISSFFFVGKSDVLSFAVQAEGAHAQSPLNQKNLASSFSVKVFCGINYLISSPENWRCKDAFAAPKLAVSQAQSPVVPTSVQASSSPDVRVIAREVIKYVPASTPVASKTIIKNLPVYITKYLPVPGPKGDKGDQGPQGPTGLSGYQGAITSGPSPQYVFQAPSTANQTFVTPTLSGPVLTNALITNATATGYFSTASLYGAGLTDCFTVSDKLIWSNGQFGCGTDSGSSGGGMSTLNGSSISSQSFTATSTGGLTLSVVTATSTGIHAFALSLASGYSIPTTASSSDWNSFFNAPSNYLTAGTNIVLSGTSTVAVSNSPSFATIFSSSSQITNSSTTALTVTGNAYFPGGIWNTNNFLGVNTLTPADLLDVESANNGSGVKIGRFSTTIGDYASLYLGVTQALAGFQKGGIFFQRTGANASGNLIFANRPGTDGTNVTPTDALMTLTSAGNIGIGTTTPSEKLSVDGNILIATNNNTQGFLFPSASGGFLQGFRANGNDISFSPYYDGLFSPFNSSGRFRPAVSNTSELGIFTHRWKALFVGTGDSSITGRLSVGTSTTNATLLVQGTSTFPALTVASSSGATLFSVLANGNVGIGTTTASGTLSIVGLDSFAGQLQLINGLTVSTFANKGNGDLHISTPAALYLNGLYAGSNFLRVDQNGRLLQNSSANSSFGGSGNFLIGTTTSLGKLSVTGTTGSLDPVLTVASSTGTSLFTVLPNGFVGIGTSTPGLPLEVYSSTANVMQLNRINSGGNNRSYLFHLGSGNFNIVDNTSGFITPFTIEANSPTASLYVKNTGNVGIGTSSPLTKLDVWGDINVATGSISTLFTSTARNYVGIGNNTFPGITTNAGSGLMVGLLTGGFDSAIDLYYDKLLNSGSIAISNGQYGKNAFSITRNNSVSTGDYQISLGGNLLITPGLGKDTLFTSGNVGIGTSTPKSLLTIATTTTSTSTSLFSVATTSSIFNILANGNIGIGTDNPTAQLQVTGSAYFGGVGVLGEFSTNGGEVRMSHNGRLRLGSTQSLAWGSGYDGNTTRDIALRRHTDGILEVFNGVTSTGLDQDRRDLLARNIFLSGSLAIGTGTSTPTSVLSVASTTASGTTNLFSVATTSQIFSILANGNVGIGSVVPTSPLQVESANTAGNIAQINYNGAVQTGATMLSMNNSGSQLFTGTGINLNLNRISAGGSGINVSAGMVGTGAQGLGGNGSALIRARFSSIYTGSSYDQVGNIVNFSRDNTISTAGQTLTVSGALASFSNTASSTVATIIDTSNILALTQGYASSTGAVLSVANSGQGPAAIFQGGNVGIGTALPSSPLNIVGSITNDQFVLAQNTNPTGISAFSSKDDVGNKFLTVGINNSAMNIGSSYGAPSEGLIRSSSLATGLTLSNVNGPMRFIQTINGAERMRLDTNGNFGIGTSAPSSLLTIQGTSTKDLLSISSSTGASLFNVLANGNVGIGTTTPLGKLQVQGTGADTDFRIGRTANQNYLSLSAPAGASFMSFVGINGSAVLGLSGVGGLSLGSYSGIDAGAGNLILPGNIGLGTSTPSQRLSVAGNMQLTGAFYDGVSNTAGTSGQVLASNGTSTYWTTISGTIGNGTLTNQTLYWNGSGWVPNSNFSVNAGGNGTSTSFAIASTTANGTTNLFSVGTTSSLFSVLANGNVGIGTTTLNSTLAIRGNLRIFDPNDDTAFEVNQAGGTRTMLINQGGMSFSTTGAFGTNTWGTFGQLEVYSQTDRTGIYTKAWPGQLNNLASFASSSGAVTAAITNSGGAFFTGNVGIGTSLPTAPLTITKNFTTPTGTEDYTAFITSKFGVADSNLKQGLRLNTYADHATGTLSNVIGLLSLYTGSQFATTTNASAIWSRVDQPAGGTTTNAYTVNAQNPVGSGYIENLYGLYVDNLTKGQNNFSIYTGSAKSSFGGRVGIGTTTPRTSLDVTGTAIIDTLGLTGTGSTLDVNRLASFNIEGASNIYMRSGSGATNVGLLLGTDRTNNVAYIQSIEPGTSYLTKPLSLNPNGGNIGIGTTTPSYTLDTYGTTRFGTTNNYQVTVDTIGLTNWLSGIKKAQTYTSSSNAMYDMFDAGSTNTVRLSSASASWFTGGNVGIGTSSPATLLHVAGNSRFDSAIYGVPTGNAVSPSYSFWGATQAGMFLASNGLRFSTNALERLSIDVAGNVGIGTTSPIALLHVFSSSSPSIKVESSGNSAAYLDIATQGTGQAMQRWATGNIARWAAGVNPSNGNNFAFSNTWDLSQPVLSLSYSTGMVGIGTSSPVSMLSITGTTTRNLLTIASSTGTTLFSIVADGKVTLGTSTGTGLLSVGGAINAGNGTVGQPAFSFLTDSTVGIYKPNTVGLGFTASGSEIMRMTTTGLGIGTTTPNYSLDVTGTGRFTGPVLAGYITTSSSTATSYFTGGINVASSSFAVNSLTGVTDISNLNIGVQSFEDNAGAVAWMDMAVTAAATIGTVESYSAMIDGNPVFTVYGESDGADGVQNLAFGIGTTTPGSTFTLQANGTNNPFNIVSASGTSFFSILANGYVGVGTSTPLTAFDITGTTTIRGAGISLLHLVPGAGLISDTGYLNVNGRAGFGYDGAQNAISITDAPGGQSSNKFFTMNLGGSEKMRVELNGNLGLGTAIPIYKLHAYSTSTGSLIMSETGGAANAGFIMRNANRSWQMSVRNDVNDSFVIRDSTIPVDRFVINSSGNIGIGTTTPNAKLEVAGPVYLGDMSSPAQGNQGLTVYTGNAANVSKGVDLIRGNSWTNPLGLMSMRLLSDAGGIYRGGIGYNASSTFAEQMTFLTNGNIGIGTSTPNARFDVVQSSFANDIARFTNSSALTSVRLSNQASIIHNYVNGVNNDSRYIISGNPSVEAMSINNQTFGGIFIGGFGSTQKYSAITSGGGSVDSGETTLNFWTNNNFSTPRMKIDQFGNIGIGTTTPLATLFVQGTSTSNPFSVASSTGASLFSVLANGNIGIGNMSPIFALEVGSNSEGKNARISSTLGAEMAPAIAGGNWTLGSGWSISSGQLIKATGSISNAAPSGAFVVVPGTTYKVVINVATSTIGNNYLAYTIGGVNGSRLDPGLITDYVTALTSAPLTFSDVTVNDSITITSISVKPLDSTTGSLTVEGNLNIKSLTSFINPVGIGVTNPTVPLQIMTTFAGDGLRIHRATNMSQYLAINESDGSAHRIQAFGDKPFIISNQAASNGINFLVNNIYEALSILPSGDVSIGTTTVGSLLSVGSTTANGTTNLFNVGTTSSIFSVLANGNVGIGTSTPSALLNLVTKGDTFAQINSGASSIGGLRLFTGDTIRGGFQFRGTNNAMEVNNYSNGPIDFYTGAIVKMRLDADGNVGIGTTTPGSRLDVWGSLNVGTSSIPTLFANTLAGKVGIGTANPVTTLGVEGGISASGNIFTVNGAVLAALSGDAVLRTYATQNLRFNAGVDAMNPHMLLTTSGNLGLGTSTPSALLSIASSTASGTSQLFSVSTSSSLFSILANGNVGIGTTNPTKTLSITGDIMIDGVIGNRIHIGAAQVGSDGAGLFTQGVSATPALRIWNSTSEVARFSESGNLGIGTTSPRSRLDIYTSTSTSDVEMFRILSDVGSAGNTIFRIDSDGDIFTDGGTTIGNPADIAENYSSTEPVEAGTVVAFASTTRNWDLLENKNTSSSYQMTEVRIARAGDVPFGVISTRPGILLGGNTTNGVPVALSGRVPVKVTNENGPILRGDNLTLSTSTPGYAMKMTESGKSLGRALSDFNPGNTAFAEGTLLVLVENTNHTVSLTGIEGLSALALATSSSENLSSESVASSLIRKMEDGIQVITSTVTIKLSAAIAYIDTIITKQLQADAIDTNIVCFGTGTNKTCLTKEKVDQLLLMQSAQSAGASSGPVVGSEGGTSSGTTTPETVPGEPDNNEGAGTSGTSTEPLPENGTSTPVVTENTEGTATSTTP